MEPNRKAWNEAQQVLRHNLAHPQDHQKTLALFLEQHAMVHSAQVTKATGLWSFEDEVLEGLDPKQMRLILPAGEHSIAWLFWHMTRIEDVTMNYLIAGSSQLLLQDDWFARLKTPERNTGNAMGADTVAALSATVNLEALSAYRLSVARRTREIVGQIKPEQLKHKVDPVRLRQIKAAGAVPDEAQGILDYWGGLTIAGLLLMPPTRHAFLHLNEALRIKHKIK